MFKKIDALTAENESGIVVSDRPMMYVTYRENGRVAVLPCDIAEYKDGQRTRVVYFPFPFFWKAPHDKETVTKEHREQIRNNIVEGLKVLGDEPEIDDVYDVDLQ